MEQISKLIVSPEFWFTAVFVQVLVGLLTNLISNNISTKWLSYLLIVNSLMLVPLPMLGYTMSSYPLAVSLLLGLVLGLCYALPVLLPTPVLRAFALLALNVPAVWIAWRIGVSKMSDQLDIFLTAYFYIALLWSFVILIWSFVFLSLSGGKFRKMLDEAETHGRSGE